MEYWPEVEQRFLVDADEAHRFLDTVRPHIPACVNDPAQPVEFVRTTYFDTDDLALFRSQLPGTAWRVRVRQYASAPDHRSAPRLTETCAFEVKEVAPFGRRKVRVVGAPAEIARIMRGRDGGLTRGARRQGIAISPLLEYAARAIENGDLQPRLTTFYRRLTYAAPGARVTVDHGIEFARPTGLGQPGEPARPESVIGHGPPLVLEVKLRQQTTPDWLASAMPRLFLVTQFSKFRDGLLAMRRAEHERENPLRVTPAHTPLPARPPHP